MSAAAELRRQVESALAGRFPAALSFRPTASPELLSCGLPEVDAVLGGGLPLGAITELTGTHSSGRTTLVLSTLAGLTAQGESCAYVDASDALNPVSAAALGVDLRRLLWIRTGEADVVVGSPYPATTSVQASQKSVGHGAGWCHPRNEAVGMHHAVRELFQTVPEEHADFTPRCSEAIPRKRVQPVAVESLAFAAPTSIPKDVQGQPSRSLFARRERGWKLLDQALRATDLLLSTGGFRALVLDMGDVAPEQARRVPLATWYRFRLQAEKSRTLFLLMTRVPCANSCAAVSLHCQQGTVDWQQAAQHSPRLLTGLHYRVSVERSRAVDLSRKKPTAYAEAIWSSTTCGAR